MQLFKRGKVWWMRFSYEGQQIRKSTETGDRKLAERIYRKVMGDIVEGRWFEKLPGEEKTFGDMMDKYLKEHVSKMKSERSFKGYVKNLKSFFGQYIVAKITPRMVAEYKVKRQGDGLKPASINRELAAMKKAFNLALKEWEWVRENPVSKVSLERENNKRDRWLTVQEENNLLRKCPRWLRDIIVLDLNTGMRLGELLDLTWKAVDMERKTITVFKAKNGERRTIPLNSAAYVTLKRTGAVRSITTDHVFFSKCHTPRDARNVRRHFEGALKTAAVGDFRFHDLRHTFATRLVQAGVDIYKVQVLLGHKSPLMTQRYAHHSPESLRDGVDILDRVRKGSTNLAQRGEKEVN